MTRRAWAADELKLAFHLYCLLPYGRLHQLNPEIIALAELIGRTPAAVALKLGNLASIDPAVRDSGRKGMGNASKLDRAIWAEFHADWEGLVLQSNQIRTDLEKAVEPTATVEPVDEKPLTDYTGNTRTQVVQQRIGQNFFRQAVLLSYDSRCCISGLAEPRLLVASHIVPWKQDQANRLNPSNGLCLSALYDSAFDQGLITLDEDWRVVLSVQLKKPEPALEQFFHSVEGQAIKLPDRFHPNPAFMQQHRESVFLDSVAG